MVSCRAATCHGPVRKGRCFCFRLLPQTAHALCGTTLCTGGSSSRPARTCLHVPACTSTLAFAAKAAVLGFMRCSTRKTASWVSAFRSLAIPAVRFSLLCRRRAHRGWLQAEKRDLRLRQSPRNLQRQPGHLALPLLHLVAETLKGRFCGRDVSTAEDEFFQDRPRVSFAVHLPIYSEKAVRAAG